MAPYVRAAALALAVTSFAFPLPALAACSTADSGARCVRALPNLDVPVRPDQVLRSASAPSTLVDVGEVVPRGEYSIILNADYYGLPPVSDGWVYMRIGSDAYRVDWQSHQVLERVTDRVAANF